jgi:iron complex transport system substrate-binding protein
MRICSLLPSATEIVAALGHADSLVAVSEECDWPPEVRRLPVVSASRVDTTRLSNLDIEHSVREAVSDGRPLYAIDRELLDALKPDLILTQNLCAVCAVSADAIGELCAADAEVVALDAHTLAEVEERIIWLGDLLGAPARGRAVVGGMEATMTTVGERVAGAPQRPVFVAEWLDPPYVAGHWIPEMVALAGGREVLAQAGAPSYPTTWEEVRQQGPELVVVAPCGFDHERAAREASLPPLGCRAVAVDSNAYYARPAPRVADGVAQLAFLIHPEFVDDPGAPVRRACAPSSEGHGRGATHGKEPAMRSATDIGRCVYDVLELGARDADDVALVGRRCCDPGPDRLRPGLAGVRSNSGPVSQPA